MRRLRELNHIRNKEWEQRLMSGAGGTEHNCDLGGAFQVPSPFSHGMLRILATTGGGWDHVSVSLELRIPTWREMDYVKRLFFRDDEVAMQLHVPPKDHISTHNNCLHLWRPHDVAIPLPPKEFV